jgi:hypothetical protein
MLPTRAHVDTRTTSRHARQRHRVAEAVAHGWTAEVVAAMPLTSTIAEVLATKASQDEAVKRARDACRLAWRATSEAGAALRE